MELIILFYQMMEVKHGKISLKVVIQIFNRFLELFIGKINISLQLGKL